MNTITGGKAPMPPWHNHAVADFGEPAKASHISKTVLSIVKFGGLVGTLTHERPYRTLPDCG